MLGDAQRQRSAQAPMLRQGEAGVGAADVGDERARQNSRPFLSSPCTPFSPFTVCVTWKSTASEQNW